MGKSVFGVGFQILRRNIFHNAELQKKTVENTAFFVIFRDVVGNSGHEQQGGARNKKIRMPLSVLITLTMVNSVKVAMMGLLEA